MNYEQKYKEALERAKTIHNEHRAQCHDIMAKVFPELAESEDGRIRKEIISLINALQSSKYTELKNYKEYIAWLEKQGERKPIEEYDVPNTPIKDSAVVTSRMKYIDENLKPIAEFIIGYANWDLRKDEWNQQVATVPLFRVLDALVQNGKQYSEEHHVV
ncbi:hypothetical protein II654_02740 [bacterium]|nr:hypothetical protein [bacterium]